MKRVSVVHVVQVWDDDHGDRYEVGEDGDGLGMTEIRYVTDDGKITTRLSIPDAALEAIGNALMDRASRKVPVQP